MSEIADTPVPATSASPAASGVRTVHEAYSFACMKCGYGWEQSYAIEHHVDGRGEPFIIYLADGERVPSPLSNPTCMNCGGHVVRIMREGQVSSVLGMIDQLYHHQIAPGIAGPVPAGANTPKGTGAPRGARRRSAHDAPGPVAVPAAERTGLFGRISALFRKG
ncbi:hypothetical protein [Streptomyces sp. NPDC006879]|uniref:hypothetical protein n=1 Tax=Streptomyces sp. NPDC006879 TaxID=3364767 RepID=UPI0036C70527